MQSKERRDKLDDVDARFLEVIEDEIGGGRRLIRR
jgi:hypothetical protein